MQNAALAISQLVALVLWPKLSLLPVFALTVAAGNLWMAWRIWRSAAGERGGR